MRVRTISVLLIIMSIYLIIAVATEVFVDDFIKPHSLFNYLLISTFISGATALAIGIEIP